VLKLTNDSLFY